VFDSVNQKNFDVIDLIVSAPTNMVWLEEHMELKMGEHTFINLIALDVNGRKFTNCTSIGVSFSTKVDSLVDIDLAYFSMYTDVRGFVLDNQLGLL
jgi:hypothetical protein